MPGQGVQPEHILHDIPDMAGFPVGRVLFVTANALTGEDGRRSLTAAMAAGAGPQQLAAATALLSEIVRNPQATRSYARFLQWSSAAFAAAKELDLPPPEGLSQSQWNRLLRDQGERLRAASLTLGSGREKMAAAQLEGFHLFLTRYGHQLPR